ncbi:MAG: hypothetical protein NVS1B12_15100 [Acidimicrobiales bacterium]
MGRIAVSVASALVALAFAFSTFERWLARRRRHELAWSGALALFVVAAAALAAGAGLGWNGPIFRIFYLFGAILNVPFLALGTVYLLWGRRTGDRVALALGLVGAFAVGVVVSSPLTGPIPRDTLVQGSAVFGVLPRVLAGVASAGGALVIVGGAVWSIVRQRRTLLSNGLIALGTLVLGASGLFNSVFDAMSAFAIALLVGITVIFAGFLAATAPTPARRSALPPGPPGPGPAPGPATRPGTPTTPLAAPGAPVPS